MSLECDISAAPVPRDIVAAISSYAGADELLWLDPDPQVLAPRPRWPATLVAARPIALIEQREGGMATLSAAGRVLDCDANAWRLLRRVLPRRGHVTAPAFGPGWYGFLGYELARQLERLPSRHALGVGLPLMRLALFDRVLLIDPTTSAYRFAHAPGLPRELGVADSQPDWRERWRHACAATAHNLGPQLGEPHFEQTRADYERRVRRALDYITAGDIYQVNLSQRIQFDCQGDALQLYLQLRTRHRAAFGAVLRWSAGGLASLSPELHLQLGGAQARTCPIKGTRPRSGVAATDRRRVAELRSSAKEQAELAMIVDLHRNDLGKVCQPGAVVVDDARRIEAHQTVFHTVADIRGTLRPDCDALDVLRAMFPAGSVTGAPKHRAMQIIDELEPARRGAYTGAIGGFTLSGAACFSVAIRCVQLANGLASAAVGGGIVADSDPSAEHAETLAKARSVLELLGSAGSPQAAPPAIVAAAL